MDYNYTSPDSYNGLLNNLTESPVSWSEAWGSRFTESFIRSPGVALWRYLEQDAPWFTDIFNDNDYDPNNPRFKPFSSEEEYQNDPNYRDNVKYYSGMTPYQAEILADRKDAEGRRESIMRRYDPSFFGSVSMFGADLMGQLVDPLNVGMAFIPVVGEARFTSWIAKYGLNRARIAKGVVEGFVGAGLAETIVLPQAMHEQANYTLKDSMTALGFGMVFGGGLHYGMGKLHDFIKPKDVNIYVKKATADILENRKTDVGETLKVDAHNEIIRRLNDTNEYNVFDPVRLEDHTTTIKKITPEGKLKGINRYGISMEKGVPVYDAEYLGLLKRQDELQERMEWLRGDMEEELIVAQKAGADSDELSLISKKFESILTEYTEQVEELAETLSVIDPADRIIDAKWADEFQDEHYKTKLEDGRLSVLEPNERANRILKDIYNKKNVDVRVKFNEQLDVEKKDWDFENAGKKISTFLRKTGKDDIADAIERIFGDVKHIYAKDVKAIFKEYGPGLRNLDDRYAMLNKKIEAKYIRQAVELDNQREVMREHIMFLNHNLVLTDDARIRLLAEQESGIKDSLNNTIDNVKNTETLGEAEYAKGSKEVDVVLKNDQTDLDEIIDIDIEEGIERINTDYLHGMDEDAAKLSDSIKETKSIKDKSMSMLEEIKRHCI